MHFIYRTRDCEALYIWNYLYYCRKECYTRPFLIKVPPIRVSLQSEAVKSSNISYRRRLFRDRLFCREWCNGDCWRSLYKQTVRNLVPTERRSVVSFSCGSFSKKRTLALAEGDPVYIDTRQCLRMRGIHTLVYADGSATNLGKSNKWISFGCPLQFARPGTVKTPDWYSKGMSVWF